QCHSAQEHECGEPDPFLETRDEAVDDRHGDEEDEPQGEDPTGSPHFTTSLASCPPWPAAASSSSSGWFASNAGRSERMRGSDVKLWRGGGQEVAHSSEPP